MTDGHYKATDILSGKVPIQQIEQRFVMVWDAGKGEGLIQAINMMASEGWAVRQCWFGAIAFAGPGHFALLERSSQSDRF